MAQNVDRRLTTNAESATESIEKKGLLDSRLDNVENISAANLMLDAKISVAKEKWFPQNWYCADVLFRCAEAGKKEMARSGHISPTLEVTMGLLDRLEAGFTSLKKNCKNKQTGLALLEGVGLRGQEADRLLNHVEPDKFLESVAQSPNVENGNVEGMATLSLYSFFQNETAMTTPSQRAFSKLYLATVQPAALVQVLEQLSTPSA